MDSGRPNFDRRASTNVVDAVTGDGVYRMCNKPGDTLQQGLGVEFGNGVAGLPCEAKQLYV